jgi:hypothetical protein
LAKRLRKQAVSCRILGSPLYEVLLECAADDVLKHGPTLAVMEPFAFAPPGAAVALKLMGAVHRLVLESRAPDLAAFYPSCGGVDPPDRVWRAFRDVLEREKDSLPALIERPVQTNEVGRCTGLVGGFHEVQRNAKLPLRILELGASGGLNLRWDHFRYEASDSGWGPPDSPVVLDAFEGPGPPFEADLEIAFRAGCDPDPIDPLEEEGRLTLSAYVWPDQEWRWRSLRGAFEIAPLVPVPIDRSEAGDWLAEQLREPQVGQATVVFHSIVLQYMTDEERRRVLGTIAAAGERASRDAPFAWLHMEPPEPSTDEADADDLAPVYLTTWPGGRRRMIARCGYHGRPVRWLGNG